MFNISDFQHGFHPSPHTARSGSIEVIVGSMFSGKTEELMRLIRRAQLARQIFQVFKPRIDDRYSQDHVVSHDKTLMTAIVIDRAAQIFEHLNPDTQVVGIDEGQFFDEELIDVCNELADRGIRVLVAGLDLNWRGEPFQPMPALMAAAEFVKKLQAICSICGGLASRTQRLIASRSDIVVGDHSTYEPRCRSCFDISLGHPDLMADESPLQREPRTQEVVQARKMRPESVDRFEKDLQL